eukprot:1383465-Amphidinium_carterae.2
MNALFWILNANAWTTFREQLKVALPDTPVKPVICLQEHRLHGDKLHAAGKEARAQGWNWFAKQAARTGSAEQATSGGVAILTPLHRHAEVIPACEEELEERTVAVSIQTGQTPLAVCCIYAQVDPTPFQVERQLELLSRWIWQQTQDWMICGDFNFEPHELSDGLWLKHNGARLCCLGAPTCFAGQPREIDWCICSQLMGQLRSPVMHKHHNSIVAPHTLLQITMQARVTAPKLRVLKKPPRFPCTEPMVRIDPEAGGGSQNAPPTALTYSDRYAEWMRAVDDVLSQAYLMAPHPERAQPPQTKLVSAEQLRAQELKARWTLYTAALILLEQAMRSDRWHSQPLHPLMTKHLHTVRLGTCEYTLDELRTLYRYATSEDRRTLQTMVQTARTKQVKREHADATKEWRRWIAEEANKGSKRAHAWMKNEPEPGNLGDLVLTLEQATLPWKQLWQRNSQAPPLLPRGSKWQLSEECVMQACCSSSPFKGTAHDSISPWHLQYLPRGLWIELMHLLNAWHEAGDTTDGNFGPIFGILYVLLPKGVNQTRPIYYRLDHCSPEAMVQSSTPATEERF